MPKSPPSPCAKPMCKELTYDRFCDKHRKEDHLNYKARRDDIEEGKFYGSAQWKKIRKVILIRDSGICQTCKRDGFLRVGNIVDHIKEIKDGGCRTCYDNLEVICASCHQKKKHGRG